MDRRITHGNDGMGSDYKQPAMKLGGRDVFVHKSVKETNDPVRIKTGPVDMEIPAVTFTWSLKAGDELTKALRPHIHTMLEGLPAHHFLAVEGEIGLKSDSYMDSKLNGLKITVIVPEK